jgi:2-polyprenyl-3-methyl-5-hydroxy-6-metoxy-1,4-benzoquinol methylase
MKDSSCVCPICSSLAHWIGERTGRLDSRMYNYFHCETCRFSFIRNPRTDYEAVYDQLYYQGRGTDPLVNYLYELEHPNATIRNYEWQGIFSIYRDLVPDRGGRWLDFGCGMGGLVRFVRQAGVDAVGFEEGWAAEIGRKHGIPIVAASELEELGGQFNFVSAIEVLEHIPDPISALKKVRTLLRPGGVLFLTTGNAQPWRSRFMDWSYIVAPEVHVSFFEPQTLTLAFEKSGFMPKQPRFYNGFVDIIKFKVLKTLGIENRHRMVDMLPWRLMTRAVDARHQVSRQPYGIAV